MSKPELSDLTFQMRGGGTSIAIAPRVSNNVTTTTIVISDGMI